MWTGALSCNNKRPLILGFRFTFVHRSSNTFLLGNKKLQHNTLPIKKTAKRHLFVHFMNWPHWYFYFSSQVLNGVSPLSLYWIFDFSNLLASLTVFGILDRTSTLTLSLPSLNFQQPGNDFIWQLKVRKVCVLFRMSFKLLIFKV